MMKGFDPRWKDLPGYILGITKEIWEDRGVHTLHGYYGKNMAKRSPEAVVVGAQNVINESLEAMAMFPGIEILGEDVIWSGDDTRGYLSSHRSVIICPHVNDGPLGPATGKRLWQYCIADCACLNNEIYDEWLVHDSAAFLRQLGREPQAFAREAVARDPACVKTLFSPKTDVKAVYAGKGNDDPNGARYADILRRIMVGDLATITRDYDRACHLQHPGGVTGHGWAAADQFWLGLKAAFPSAAFEIHHMIGRDDAGFSPRAALRWSLTGTHDSWGAFGAPSGASVHIMGISHAEFGPWGLRREFVLLDEVSIWKQIVAKSG
jgi:SnoaL-like domain